MNKNASLILNLLATLSLIAFGFMLVHIIALPVSSSGFTFDIAVLRFAGSLRSDTLNIIFKFITNLGGTAFLVAAAAVLVLVPKLRQDYGFAVVLPLAAASLCNAAFKHLIVRSRPQVIPQLVSEHTFSFPSGHTTSSMVFYLLLAYYTCKLIKEQKNRTLKFVLKVLFAIFLILPFLIASSRIYLGVHYPSDVIAGIFLATFFVLSAISFTPYTRFLQKY